MTPAFLSAIKAYDIRGIVPDQIDNVFARELGYAFATLVTSGATLLADAQYRVLLGHDIRLSGPEFVSELAIGLTFGGVSPSSIGLCGTEEIYHGVVEGNFDGGIMVTASHNPKGYNGFKLVGAGSCPIYNETGLDQIKSHVLGRVQDGSYGQLGVSDTMSMESIDRTGVAKVNFQDIYVEKILGFVEPASLSGLKIVLNAGNGSAGPILEKLAKRLPAELIVIHGEADGHFPHGVPNPLLPDRRSVTSESVIAHGADFGVAFDGDFDRCFFFDEQGQFIEGYYLVGFLAEYFLSTVPTSKRSDAVILHDPRLLWGTTALVRNMGAQTMQGQTGHAFMKQLMRDSGAIYGGEMSAHHYFRDFFCCDSGMIPWLIVGSRIKEFGPLSSQMAKRMAAFPTQGEINLKVSDIDAVLGSIEHHFTVSSSGMHQSIDKPVSIDHLDGLSISFSDWRFNLRASNTEPLLRLNLESRGDRALMERKTRYVLDLITKLSTQSSANAASDQSSEQ